jgi:plastocyanin
LLGGVALVLLAGAEPAPAAAAGGNVSGRITGKLAGGKLVVYLDGAKRPARRGTMKQRDLQFDPGFLAVGVGESVDFPNADTVTHNVFSVSKPKKFDLGLYPAGKSKAVTFDKPGHVDVFCNIHSDMHAAIEIVPSGLYVVADAKGRFDLGEVPAGKHTLVVARKGKVVASKSIVVAGGKKLTVDLALP